MFEGSCLCGGIRYQVQGELSDFGYCHCRSCQKASGSAYGANAGVDRTHFQLHDPGRLLTEYESSPGKKRAFCATCGSPLFAYLDRSPQLIRIRLGTLDTPLSKTTRAHTFVRDKAAWEDITGDVPQFDEWASRDVLVQSGSRQPRD